MDSITRAVQRARESVHIPANIDTFAKRFGISDGAREEDGELIQASARSPDAVELDEAVLRSNRIVGFDADANPSRHYDLIRNQVVHNRRKPGTLIIGVAAPVSRCGASVTAINLAFSFARNRAQRVVLLDANDHNPSVRRYLGMPGDGWPKQIHRPSGEFLTTAQARDASIRILSLAYPDHDGAQALIRMARATRDDEATVVVFDLPPLLSTDTAMSYLAVSTCVVVVLAAGKTTLAEVESCKSLLGERDGVQFVLNGAGRHGL